MTQHTPLLRDFRIRTLKDKRRRFLPQRKIWKLHKDSLKSDFSSYINSCKVISQ